MDYMKVVTCTTAIKHEGKCIALFFYFDLKVLKRNHPRPHLEPLRKSAGIYTTERTISLI